MTGTWRPMGQSAEEAGGLHEGIPEWMVRSLWEWIQNRVQPYSNGGRRRLRPEVVDRFERIRRAGDPITEEFERIGLTALQVGWTIKRDILPFVDYLIHELGTAGDSKALDSLERILVESGSAWTVGTRDGQPGLERRVPLGVQEVAEHAMVTAGRAGERLSEAWHATFGVSPNPTLAYALAVRAVEDATIQRVVPSQKDPTLGHVIGQLRNDSDWGLPLTREDPSAPTSETIVRMAKALWKGHHDRHGGDPNAPKSVSQEEAEAAVLLAVSLVHWFSSGAAARR
ncbi:hypothetical protein ACFO6V_23780 [Promicromonospora alba]|uniref:Abortive infection Abi-like protein n=1 Tax=Promicromonospora alba TaxID=1616110 RepID=A0ABV9HNA1_9MICO